jgi:nitrate/nitrite transport system ATP-binding protein
MPFLEIQNVTKRFSSGKGSLEVLKNVCLAMNEGEFICVVGYSGAGKSTLINLVAGLSEPDEGRLFFETKPIHGTSLDRGLIFQNYSLLPWLTALGNVMLAVEQCFPELVSKKEIMERAAGYLELVKLGHAMNRRPAELSGGMRQRVSLARGLAMEPAILLLDEPLGALDALTRAELQDELVRIQEQKRRSILMITNDVDEAIMVADRVYPMSAGPSATLGESIPITVPRPRDRKSMNHNPDYHHDRKRILKYLLSHGPEMTQVPDAEPTLDPFPERLPLHAPS